jgi:hypothetical protein
MLIAPCRFFRFNFFRCVGVNPQSSCARRLVIGWSVKDLR